MKSDQPAAALVSCTVTLGAATRMSPAAKASISADFCRRLLAEAGVALTPGLDFDPVDGGSWVRLSFAGTTEEVAEAARRLANWLVR